MTETAFKSATELAAMIRKREIGAEELLDLYFARIDDHNPALNAVIWEDREGARETARTADSLTASGGDLPPLHGVPMTIKESYDLAGSPTTWGDPEFRDNIAETDSVSVARLKAAGVNLFGKTNVPLMLADWQSYNDIYGVTNNPWDLGPHAGRLLGRVGRGAGGRHDRHRGRQRHRLLDPQPRALLRRLRPQAELGYLPAARAGAAGRAGAVGHLRGRAAGAFCGRPGGGARRHGRPGRDGSSRLPA